MDPITEDTLRRLNTDVLFAGVDGLDAHYKRVAAVCDASKFGLRTLSLIVPPAGTHHVITDRAAPNSDLKAFRKAGIEVTLV